MARAKKYFPRNSRQETRRVQMGFLSRVFGKSRDSNSSSGAEFLGQLTQEEKVAIGNLNPVIYTTVIQEKKGQSTINIVTDDDRTIQLLRKLEISDLERLLRSVNSTLEADKAASQGNMSEAARLYKRTVELNPYDDLALMSYGVSLARQGNLREGIKWVEKAVNVNPKNERARRNLQGMKADL
jgi:tetratricopeptide (TPR) repeat protein